MEDLTALQNQVNELKQRLDNLSRADTIPVEIVEALISRGFLKHDGEITFTGGVGGNVFSQMFIRYLQARSIIGFSPSPFGFVVKSVSGNTCACTDSNVDMAEIESAGLPIFFYTTDTLPGGLDNPVATYFIFNASGNEFQLTTDGGLTAVDITDVGSGVHFFSQY